MFWYIFRYAILDSEGFRALICAFYLQMVALKIAKCGFPIRLDSLKVHRNSMTIFAIGNGIAANHLQKKKKKRFVIFANLWGVNTITVIGFKLTKKMSLNSKLGRNTHEWFF